MEKTCKWCKKEFEDTTIRKKMVFCCRRCYQHNENAKARAKTATKIPPKIGNCCKQCGGEKETRQSQYCRPCKTKIRAEYQVTWKLKKGYKVLSEEERQKRKSKRRIQIESNAEVRERKIKRLNKGILEDGRDVKEIIEHEENYVSRDKKAVIVQRDYTKKERQLIDDFLKTHAVKIVD